MKSGNQFTDMKDIMRRVAVGESGVLNAIPETGGVGTRIEKRS